METVHPPLNQPSMNTRITFEKIVSDGTCHGCCFWKGMPTPGCLLANHEDHNAPIYCIDPKGVNYIYKVVKEGGSDE